MKLGEKVVYKNYMIVRTLDDFEIQDSEGNVITWGYSLKGAQLRVDQIIEEDVD